jgi:hypothetical protein
MIVVAPNRDRQATAHQVQGMLLPVSVPVGAECKPRCAARDQENEWTPKWSPTLGYEQSWSEPKANELA